MSDLGSEELEEEGETDLGVRAPAEGGASRGARRQADSRRPGSHNREVWRPVTAPPLPPPPPAPGGPARDQEHAGHSGRCVLEVGGERGNVMTSAGHIPSRSVPLPNPPPVKGKDFQVKGPSILLPAITSHPGGFLGWLAPPKGPYYC